MKLIIPNWRRAPRMATVWVGLLATGFGLLPLDQQLAILALAGITPLQAPAVIGVTFIVARMIDQPSTRVMPSNPPDP